MRFFKVMFLCLMALMAVTSAWAIETAMVRNDQLAGMLPTVIASSTVNSSSDATFFDEYCDIYRFELTNVNNSTSTLISAISQAEIIIYSAQQEVASQKSLVIYNVYAYNMLPPVTMAGQKVRTFFACLHDEIRMEKRRTVLFALQNFPNPFNSNVTGDRAADPTTTVLLV